MNHSFAMMDAWMTYYDANGIAYYYNPLTQVSTYDPPGAYAPSTTGSLSGSNAVNFAAHASMNAAPAVLTSAVKFTQRQVDEAWMAVEDAHSKKTYYVNTLTKESVWEEPEALKIQKAKAAVKQLQQQLSAEKKTASTVNDENIETPGELLNEAMHHVEDDSLGRDGANSSHDGGHGSEFERNSQKGTKDLLSWDHLSKEDRIQAFKKYLEDCDISSKIKWTDALKIIKEKPRWNILDTLGDKKQAFAEYQTHRAKYEVQLAKRQEKTNRENFRKMLAACQQITSKTSWVTAVELLGEDERFVAIKNERDRREIFHEFIEEMTRTEREYQRTRYHERKRLFVDILRDVFQNQGRTLSGTTRLGGEAKQCLLDDSRMQEMKLSSDEVYGFFNEYVNELREQEIRQRREEKEKQRLREKECTESFQKYLKEEVSQKRLTLRMKWKNFQPTLESLEIYRDLLQCVHGDVLVIRKIYEDTLLELNEKLGKIEDVCLRKLKRKKYKIQYNSSLDEMFCVLDKSADKLNEDVDEIDCLDFSTRYKNELGVIFFNIQQEEIKYHEQDVEDKKEFETLLTEYFYRSDHLGIEWDEAKEQLRERTAYQNLKRSKRQEVFERYMKGLRKEFEKLSGKSVRSPRGEKEKKKTKKSKTKKTKKTKTKIKSPSKGVKESQSSRTTSQSLSEAAPRKRKHSASLSSSSPPSSSPSSSSSSSSDDDDDASQSSDASRSSTDDRLSSKEHRDRHGRRRLHHRQQL